MILDKLDNSEQYERLHPLFKQAFDYLKTNNFSETETGKTELKNKDLFIIISDSNMSSQEKTSLEAHKKYIDIQLPVSKVEKFGWKARKDIQNATCDYDEEKDIQFFSDKPVSYIDVEPGNFIIFFPEDGHAPCIGEGRIRKVVVKIRL